ncbi:MAG: thiamine pyrophosphate-dependent enzyme [Paludibaculum sp.]
MHPRQGRLLLRALRAQGRSTAPDALLPRLRPRHRAQAAGRIHRRNSASATASILVSPVGCSVFLYYYFDVGNVQVAHGRAPAVATALKRAHPEAIVISYQGDGDLAAIGSAEILHAANRGENYTSIFINNAIYGMTGGQMAPTTLMGNRTTTTPFGRNVFNDGYPLHVSEVIATLEAPAYVERAALGNTKHILQAKKAIKKALETQMKGLGFSMIEILFPAPPSGKWIRSTPRNTCAKVWPLSIRSASSATAPGKPNRAPPSRLLRRWRNCRGFSSSTKGPSRQHRRITKPSISV